MPTASGIELFLIESILERGRRAWQRANDSKMQLQLWKTRLPFPERLPAPARLPCPGILTAIAAREGMAKIASRGVRPLLNVAGRLDPLHSIVVPGTLGMEDGLCIVNERLDEVVEEIDIGSWLPDSVDGCGSGAGGNLPWFHVQVRRVIEPAPFPYIVDVAANQGARLALHNRGCQENNPSLLSRSS